VHDLKAALAHYAALGFEVPEDPAGSDSATATRDGVELRLCQSDFDPATEAGCIYLVADDPDQLWHEWSRPGIGGRGRAPRATDDDAYAGSHIDPDGNCIMFGTPVSPA
jgi:predicted lactoylglutathione lyase